MHNKLHRQSSLRELPISATAPKNPTNEGDQPLGVGLLLYDKYY